MEEREECETMVGAGGSEVMGVSGTGKVTCGDEDD